MTSLLCADFNLEEVHMDSIKETLMMGFRSSIFISFVCLVRNNNAAAHKHNCNVQPIGVYTSYIPFLIGKALRPAACEEVNTHAFEHPTAMIITSNSWSLHVFEGSP